MAKKRDCWVDNVKVVACILVVLGHFFQSMVKAEIIADSSLYQWFNTTIYYFHVPLFFICSGYLYQKYSRVDNDDSWFRNVLKKGLALGIPYFTFSTITWVLKTVFSGSVNDQIGGLGSTLFLHPTSPYWYLYCLFFIFVVTPTFASKKTSLIGLIIALAMKLVSLAGGGTSVYAINTVLSNEIWFVLGMSINWLELSWVKPQFGVILFGLFLVLSILPVDFWGMSFVFGIIACLGVVMMLYKTKYDSPLARYTMPIFLMHTLFAATMRSVLLKLGIGSSVIHVVLGLGISFVGPIIAAWIMKKTKWLEFFLYPNKFVKIRN